MNKSTMALKFTAFLAFLTTLTLAVHGCEPNCYNQAPPPPAVPTPPSSTTCGYNITQLSPCLTLSVITKDSECCSLLQGLSDLEAAACACLCLGPLTVDANVLLKKCDRACPAGYTCPRWICARVCCTCVTLCVTSDESYGYVSSSRQVVLRFFIFFFLFSTSLVYM